MTSAEQRHAKVDQDLLQQILNELNASRSASDVEYNNKVNQRFGKLLQILLTQQRCSRETFAKALDLEREFVDVLLDGWFPNSELSDDFLIDVAEFVEQDVDLLRAILGRVPPPCDVDGFRVNPPPPTSTMSKRLKNPLEFLSNVRQEAIMGSQLKGEY